MIYPFAFGSNAFQFFKNQEFYFDFLSNTKEPRQYRYQFSFGVYGRQITLIWFGMMVVVSFKLRELARLLFQKLNYKTQRSAIKIRFIEFP